MSNSNGSTTATALRSPPRTPDRPTPSSSSGRPSTDRHHSTRERASTVTPEHRVYGRRPRRGLNSAGTMSSTSTSSTPASPAPGGQPQTDEQSTRGGLEGPLTPTGGRQTLQEFLQSIETVSRPARPERAGGHRHTVSSMGPGDTQSPRAVGRRRSMPLAGTDHSAAAATAGYPYGGANPPIPNSPPPSYQRGDYRGDLQEEGREPHPGRRVSMDNLASSFYLKPKWQPDVEVSECPICKRPFTFFYRKHHCRKCGRVVCANCSPHRITIPRQYIVEPPLEGCEGEQEETLRAETDDEGHEEALFGGQEVRLCNPCVPDPNPLPPPDYTSTTAQNILSTFPPQSPSEEQQQQRTPTAAQQPQFDRSRYPRRSNSQRDWLGPFGESMPAEYVRQRSATDPHRRMGGPTSPTTGHRHSRSHYGTIEQASSGMEAMGLHSAVQRSSSHRHRSHGSTSGLPYQHPYYQQQAQLSSERSLPNLTAPPFAQPASSTAAAAAAAASAAPPPRRIPEEDECPVCHEEMPPKGPDGSEDAREQHISECIDQHLHPGARTVPSARSAGDSTSAPDSDTTTTTANPSTSAPSSSNFAAQMPGAAGGAAGAGAGASASASASSSSAMNAGHYSYGGGGRRPRAETHAAGMGVFRRANMLVYHASEKDCLDAEGRQKECVICLEDFVVGAELGRLECWCVFHRPCIREWWDTKGLGACPTHQVGI